LFNTAISHDNYLNIFTDIKVAHNNRLWDTSRAI